MMRSSSALRTLTYPCTNKKNLANSFSIRINNPSVGVSDVINSEYGNKVSRTFLKEFTGLSNLFIFNDLNSFTYSIWNKT
ncbi:protein of unknown function [Xenorhabdus nematophila AN6/1]|nr:protein of unknown function [Xenorhabdus nematophila AN6/1]